MNMDDKRITHKVLHLITDKFIFALDDYIELKKVKKTKVYLELLKRKIIISHGIGAIAKNILISYQLNGVDFSSDVIKKKVEKLVEGILQQDLLECSFSSNDETCISSDDLHQIIFACSLKDVAPHLSPFMNEISSLTFSGYEFSGHSWQSPFSSYTSDMINNNCPSMSAEFENSLHQFKDDLTNKKIANGIDLSFSGLKTSDIAARLYNEKVRNDTQKLFKTLNCLNSPKVENSLGDWLFSSYLSESKDAIESPDSCLNVLSWENKMKQSVPCHLYSSELTEKEALYNITDEDSQLFRSLNEASSVLLEKDFILDILDLLVGLPSSTFFYDESKSKFSMKPFVHLQKLSHESTSRFCEKFIECGTLFYKLKVFSSEHILQKGMILQGLKDGVFEILSVFMMYIYAVKANKPTMQMLKADILENAQLLIVLGKICGIHFNQKVPVEFSKGLILLSSISSAAWSCRNKDNIIMIAVLLKHIFLPYFSFLNKWLDEGNCYDPYDEFQIVEDFKYLERRDELYWKFTYTENEDDDSRLIPQEIKKFSHEILQCGKSMRLLQDCCPQLFSLEYLSCNPPPPLKMVFSYHAVTQKKNQCNYYIEEKSEAEAKYKELGCAISDDTFHIEKQKLVDHKAVLSSIKRRWKWLLGIKQSTKNLSTNATKGTCLRKSSSFPSLTSLKEDIGFNGWIFENTGLLFSCCGCSEKNESLGSDSSDIKPKPPTTLSKKFNLQLNLKSYYHSVPYAEPIQKKFKFLFVDNKMKESNACPTKSELQENSLHHIPPGSFLDSLATLLISEYEDSKEDILAFLKLISLQKLLEYNFSPVLNMRMHLIQKAIMDYIVYQLKFIDLLQCLKNTYFLQDESFSQSLCERLFLRALKCSNLHEFTDWITLNEILSRAVSVPSLSNIPFLDTSSVNFVNLPEGEVTERHLFFHYFQFEFKIVWPLNIIIHRACITQYTEMFSSLMEMEFLCWLLGKLWRLFHTDTKSSVEDSSLLESSPQYREIMLNRFDMHQFIRVLHNCIHQDVGGPLWDFLLKSLNTEELSIDALEDIHCQYLEKALARCFLTEETTFLRDLLKLLFLQVYKFCEVALECSWELNSSLNQYETSDFERLSSFFSSYKKCKEKFYDKIMQIVGRKKYKRTWDDEYPQFLEILLETGKLSS